MKLKKLSAQLRAAVQVVTARRTKTEKAILRHAEVFAQHLQIGIDHEDIVDRINAFDWLDIQDADNEEAFAKIVMRFYDSFNFRVNADAQGLVLQAFTFKFVEAVTFIREAIVHTHASYNVEGSSKGFTNPVVDKFYYINYWATKKSIPVNYNEKRQEHRALFNMDTIILSILADKLNVFNEYERNKPKPKA
jgi:hypothetical protein